MEMKITDSRFLKAAPPGFIERFERSAVYPGEYIV
jgi:hypothetical protein